MYKRITTAILVALALSSGQVLADPKTEELPTYGPIPLPADWEEPPPEVCYVNGQDPIPGGEWVYINNGPGTTQWSFLGCGYPVQETRAQYFDMYATGDYIIAECARLGGTVAYHHTPYYMRLNNYICKNIPVL